MNTNRIYYSHEAEMHAARKLTLVALVLLALGLGVGTVVALLFAPTSGKKARQELSQNIEEGLRSGREALEPVVKRVEEQLSELRKNVDERLNPS